MPPPLLPIDRDEFYRHKDDPYAHGAVRTAIEHSSDQIRTALENRFSEYANRFSEYDDRLGKLEKFRARMEGGLAVLSVIAGTGLIVDIGRIFRWW